MAISFVGSASAQTTGTSTPVDTSIVTPLPAGIQSDDLILIAVHRSHNYTLGTPTGYTSLDEVIDFGTSPSAADVTVFYRVADGSEATPGPTFTTSTATRFIVHAAVYRGVDTTSPFIDHAGQTTPTSTASRVAPAITNTDVNAWAVFCTNVRNLASPVTFTAPSGMTERQDSDVGTTSNTGTNANLAAEWADTNGAVGSTGSITYTGSSSGNSAIGDAWAAFLTSATGAGPVAGACVAAGVGGATFGSVASGFGAAFGAAFGGGGGGGSTPVLIVLGQLVGGGQGTATVGTGSVTWTGIPLARGIGTADIVDRQTEFGLAVAAGAGAATVGGRVTVSPTGVVAAGLGGASIVGTVGLIVPSHVATQARLASDGIYTATVLAVAPFDAVLASSGIANAQIASGVADAKVLAVAPFDATVQTT